jgi:hypothetical protein
MNTCTGTTYDSKIGVFSGTCAAPVCVTGNDDFCGLQSQVTFASALGTTYYVLVTGFSTNTGAFTLTTTCAAAIPNDICTTPLLLVAVKRSPEPQLEQHRMRWRLVQVLP